MKRRLIAGTINRYPAEEGWENVHLDRSGRRLWDLKRGNFGPPAEVQAHLGAPAWETFVDGRFDEVRCHQVLEHLTPEEAPNALNGFYELLDPGGTLDVEVPHIAAIIGGYVEGKLTWQDLLRNVYGSSTSMPDDHLNAHRWGYSCETLTAALTVAGFTEIEHVDPGYQLRLRATRP